MNENWPESLPRPKNDQGAQASTNVLRTEMATGKARQRQQFDDTMELVSVTWTMSDLEFTLFKTWYKLKIKNGTDWFYLPLALGDGIRNLSLIHI